MNRRVLLVAGSVLALTLTLSAFGQPVEPQPGNALGYTFVSWGAQIYEGGSVATFHVGGGGEIFLTRRLSLGGELGHLGLARNPFEGGVGLLSSGGTYHFGSGKTTPFVAGGYNLIFRSDTAHGAYFGGGVDHWFSENFALRLEGRNHWIASFRDDLNFLQFRVGFLFK